MRKDLWQMKYPAPTESYHSRVNSTLSSLPVEKEVFHMKLKKRYIVPVMALLVTFCFGTGLIATGTITNWFSSSPEKSTYTEFPSTDTLNNDLGFEAKIVSSFENGYVFHNATVGKEQGKDDNGNTLSHSNFLSVEYRNSSDEIVNLYVSKKHSNDDDSAVKSTERFCDIDLKYGFYEWKMLPSDYVMTDKDKADEKNGKYIFSFGEVDDVEISNVQYVLWVDDGVSYNLMATDSSLTQEEFFTMAKELVEQ